MNNKYKMQLQLFAEKRKTKAEIETRLSEIRTTLENGEGNLDELELEIKNLQEERNALDEIEKRSKIALSLNSGSSSGEINTPEELSVKEQRGKDLRENRAVLVSSESIVLPKHTSPNINPTFNEVSSLLYRVKHVDLPGGESYSVPYLIHETGEAGYTAEGADYKDVEPKFGYALISKTKTTAYSEVSEEMEKLPLANYADVVQRGVNSSINKQLSKQILIGNGETNNIVGIFSDKATAIDAKTDKIITTIDENTLDDIVFSYGGEEDVEDIAVLILSKADVKQFAMLRNDGGEKVYDVKPNGNTGTINTIPYVINSACSSISKGPAGEYCMVYGPLSNYEFATFSPLELKRSDDFKFKQGMIANRGSVFTGGNVVAYNGFLRVKKGADTGK